MRAKHQPKASSLARRIFAFKQNATIAKFALCRSNRPLVIGDYGGTLNRITLEAHEPKAGIYQDAVELRMNAMRSLATPGRRPTLAVLTQGHPKPWKRRVTSTKRCTTPWPTRSAGLRAALPSSGTQTDAACFSRRSAARRPGIRHPMARKFEDFSFRSRPDLCTLSAMHIVG